MFGLIYLVIVMVVEGEKVVSYVDINGELLDVDYVIDGEFVFIGINFIKLGY